MHLAVLGGFAAAIFVAAVIPGPAVVAIVARVLGRGPAGAVALASGILLGSWVWLTLVAAGLALIAQAFGALLLILRYAGAAYLLFMAYRLWTAPAAAPGDATSVRHERPSRLFLGGLALELGNPKTMVFYLALVPSIVDLRAVTPAMFVALSLVVLCVVGGVFAGYITLAARSRRFFGDAGRARAVNRVGGAAMAGAAVAFATR